MELTRFAASVGLIASFAGAGTALAGGRVIAYTGMDAPGQPPGTVVNGLGSLADHVRGPVINSSGEILLFAELSEPGLSTGLRSSVLRHDGDLLSLIAAEDQQAPDLPGSSSTLVVISPRIVLDDAGRGCFFATVDVAGDTYRDGLWATDASGDLRLVVREGQTLPQSDPVSPVFGWQFSDLTDGSWFFGGGRAGFWATAADPAAPSSTVDGLWSERPAVWPRELRVVARGGADTDFGGVNPSGVNSHGETIFRANVPDGPSIWSEAGGVLTQVAQAGSGAGGDVTFTSFGEPDMNDVGNSAWRASFSDHPSGAASGIWKQMPLTAGVVAVEGMVAPGLPDLNGDGVSDYVFGLFGNVRALISRDGPVAFLASAHTLDFSDQLRGVWTDRNGGLDQLELVALVGDRPPGLPPGAEFVSFDRESLVINANGDIAFKAQWQSPDASQAWGIWAEQGRKLTLVAKAVLSGADTGDIVVLPDGTQFETRFVYLAGATGNEDGRPSGFSDNGDLVYRAAESSGDSAILVVDLGLFVDGFESGDTGAWSGVEP